MELLAVLVLAWIGIAFVHEYGHVVAGVLVGVPRNEMRVSFRGVPHVALRGDGAWVRPGVPAYGEAFGRHVTTMPSAFLYVAGGTVAQTLAVGAFAGAAAAAGAPWPGQAVARVSLGILAVYVVLEAVLLRVRGHPFGDFSALWRMSRPWTAALVAGSTVVHVLALAVTR